MSTSQTAEPSVSAAESSDGRRDTIELDVSGMTCGSCAARVQRALGEQPGVSEALVNYATGRATVELDPGALDATERLVAAVQRAGYGASPVGSERERAGAAARGARARRGARAGRPAVARIAVAVPLAAAIAVLTYADPHDPTARWITAALAVPVQFWCGLPFLRSAWARARARVDQHGHADRAQHAGELRLLDRDAAHRRRACTSTACRSASSTCRSTTTWARSSSPRC